MKTCPTCEHRPHTKPCGVATCPNDFNGDICPCSPCKCETVLNWCADGTCGKWWVCPTCAEMSREV